MISGFLRVVICFLDNPHFLNGRLKLSPVKSSCFIPGTNADDLTSACCRKMSVAGSSSSSKDDAGIWLSAIF